MLLLPIAQAHVSVIKRGALLLAAYFEAEVGLVWRLWLPQFKELRFVVIFTVKLIFLMQFYFRGSHVLML